MSLEGRRALVTAGSSGIGRAVAERLRREGATVFITGSREPVVAAAADEIGAAGYLVADFSQAGAASDAVGAARHVLGGLDILVSNTGGPRAARFLDLSSEDWDRAYRLVLDSAVELTRAALPDMIGAGWGRLIYLASSGVVRPLPALHLSNVMRAGVAALAASLTGEVAPHGVTTHVIGPAHIDTARRDELMRVWAERLGIGIEELNERQLATVPVGRWGTVDDVAALAAFLCSEEAGFLTGNLHLVDGGCTKILEPVS